MLASDHYKLVDRIASKLMMKIPPHAAIDHDDLVQAGRIGLMQACKSFKPEKGYKFATFASPRILGAMQDELRKMDHVARLIRQKEKQRQQAELVVGTDKEKVKTHLKWNDVDYEMSWPTQIRPLTSLAGDNDKEYIAEPFELPKFQLDEESNFYFITKGLTLDEKLILYFYYWKDKTMKQIGEMLDLSESRICQIHTRLLARLKIQK